MNASETTKFREKVNECLYSIKNLKDKLERLENSETNSIRISLEFGKVNISNESIIGIPVREFIKHQIIIRLKDKIKKEEERLQTLKYYIE